MLKLKMMLIATVTLMVISMLHGVPQDFLVPDFRNAPDPNDIIALRWAILSKDTVSDLQIYFNEIKQLHKEDLYWPLLECFDMVHNSHPYHQFDIRNIPPIYRY